VLKATARANGAIGLQPSLGFESDFAKIDAMPTSLKISPYCFYFYADDCDEPRHTHVDRGNKMAKFWLDPEVYLAESYGYSARELREIERLVYENLETLKNEWDNFCGNRNT
jgi:Domain of unknown function (DUF4160)